jgi:hypothetical protein
MLEKKRPRTEQCYYRGLDGIGMGEILYYPTANFIKTLLRRLATLRCTICRLTALSKAEIYARATCWTSGDPTPIAARSLLARVLMTLRTAPFSKARRFVCNTDFCAAFLFAIQYLYNQYASHRRQKIMGVKKKNPFFKIFFCSTQKNASRALQLLGVAIFGKSI